MEKIMEKTGEARPVPARFSVRKISVIGMLSSISVVLGISGYGFIPLPAIRATILHIPVIIGAILEGPLAGMMIGFIFGLFSIIQNLAAPTLLSFALINPLVSVLPRVLIGVTSYYVYCSVRKFLSQKYESVAIGLGAAVGALTNTVGVLFMIYLLYAAQFAAARGISLEDTAAVVSGIAITYGIPEAVASIVICIPVVMAVNRRRK